MSRRVLLAHMAQIPVKPMCPAALTVLLASTVPAQPTTPPAPWHPRVLVVQAMCAMGVHSWRARPAR